MRVELGVTAVDRVSGFKGVVIARTEWLHGCVRVALAPKKTDKDGKVIEEQWFDQDRVRVVDSLIPKSLNAIFPEAPRTGGGREETRSYSKA